MASLDDLRRRHSAGPKTVASPAPTPATGRHPSGAVWRSTKPTVVDMAATPAGMLLHRDWRHLLNQYIVAGVVSRLPDSRADLAGPDTSRVVVWHQSRQWPVTPEVVQGLSVAEENFGHELIPEHELKAIADGQAHYAAKRIRDAAIGRLFPAGRDSDDGSTEPPPTSRSPGTPRKGGVDIGKLRAAVKAEGGAPRRPRPSDVILLDKRFTISVAGDDAVMNVGKFKGQCLTDVVKIDKGYLEWVLSNKHTGDFQPWPRDVLDVVRHVLNNPMKVDSAGYCRHCSGVGKALPGGCEKCHRVFGKVRK